MAAQGAPSAARVPYGARGDFPSAVDMGDKALYVDPSDNQALWQVQSGNWVKIALGSGSGGGAPAGVPVLHGPYAIDFGDIPHDGDTKTLWTPAAGDVLLSLTCDFGSAVAGATAGGPMSAAGLNVGTAGDPTLLCAGNDFTSFNLGTSNGKVPRAFGSAAPLQVAYAAAGEGDLTAGHVELYALVARALAP